METTAGEFARSGKYKSVNTQDIQDSNSVHGYTLAQKVFVAICVLLGWILFILFAVLYGIELNKDSDSLHYTNGDKLSPILDPTLNPTISPTQSQLPKNLIIIISDGMGQTYNTAYRIYKNLTRTTMDKYFKGRYSTSPTNEDSITDSAAGATVFACGVSSRNGFIGLDGYGNPHGSILAAAKRQGKGTGLIATKSVTDATPASFSAHSMYRSFYALISRQQAQTQINGAPMLDLILGGGRKWFESWGFYDNVTLQKQYGWNKVSKNGTDFLLDVDNPNINDLPYMGLFADDGYPYYLDRINGYIKLLDESSAPYPGMLAMAKKAINLLSNKYSDEGFFLMIEASEIDLCGHDNDIVCLLWEVEEFMDTADYVFDWAHNNSETLVVVLSDHETGGMSIARDGSYINDDLVNYWQGKMPKDGYIADAWGSYHYDYSISAQDDISDTITNYGAYKWFPESIADARHTASWFADQLGTNSTIVGIRNLTDLFEAIEDNYLGSFDPTLTDKEKEFIADLYERDSYTQKVNIAQIMSSRTLTGWTTHGHSGADVAVHAFGPNEDLFIGHFANYEIGKILTDAFGVGDEQAMETQYLKELFLNGSLALCDAANKPEPNRLYVEWNSSVAYPEGNLLYPDGKCVESWII